jgi:hypothetical protein
MCSPNDDIYLPHSTKTICDQIIMDHYYYTHRGTKEEHVDAIVVVHPRILATGTHSPTFSTFFLPMSQQHTSNGNTFTHVPHIFLPMSQQRQYLSIACTHARIKTSRYPCTRTTCAWRERAATTWVSITLAEVKKMSTMCLSSNTLSIHTMYIYLLISFYFKGLLLFLYIKIVFRHIVNTMTL